MKKVNFRALIFIDLLASAMGGSIILMLIFASNKVKFPLPGGKPRDFIFYKVVVPDTESRIKIFVHYATRSSKWYESDFYNNKGSDQSFLGQVDMIPQVKMWGPAISKNPLEKGKQIYNVYVTATDSSEWIFTVLFYESTAINKAKGSNKFVAIDKKIIIEQHYRTRLQKDTAIKGEAYVGDFVTPTVVVSYQKKSKS